MTMISVIVPVYKVESYLRRCVNSILNQTYRDFELVLVDDGSPDKCGKLCDDFAKTDSRVYVIHRENGGLSAARNSGIEWALANSDSEWITFIDSDDWVHTRYLELLYQAVRSTGLDIGVGSFDRVQNEIVEPDIPDRPVAGICETESFYCMNKVNATVAWGKLYRKKDFESVRYPVGRIHEDEFTTYKLLFRYSELAFSDYPLYFYFQNTQSIMGSGWNPKHIAECDGMQEQIAFFENSGKLKAKEYVSKLYLTSIYRNLLKAKERDEYHSEEVMLRSRLKNELKRYGEMTHTTFRNAPWLYYEAHPVLTLPYRAIKKLFGKR